MLVLFPVVACDRGQFSSEEESIFRTGRSRCTLKADIPVAARDRDVSRLSSENEGKQRGHPAQRHLDSEGHVNIEFQH